MYFNTTDNRAYSYNGTAWVAMDAVDAPSETPTTLGAIVSGADAKTTPVDADLIPLVDSAASTLLKKLTWANVKATAKTYFDTLYAAITHNHDASAINAGTLPVARGGTGHQCGCTDGEHGDYRGDLLYFIRNQSSSIVCCQPSNHELRLYFCCQV